MQDDLSDLMLDSNDIQEALGRSYLTPDIDESELESELDALGEDMLSEATPSYLSALPEAPSEPTSNPRQPVPMGNH
jgi:charged multivesicular body protein 5